jgi:transcriptional regulator with XRE-family HTH domain
MNALAAKAGLSQQMVSFVEREMRNPSLDTLVLMTDALGLELWRVLKDAAN